jgi:hypothetical protein
VKVLILLLCCTGVGVYPVLYCSPATTSYAGEASYCTSLGEARHSGAPLFSLVLMSVKAAGRIPSSPLAKLLRAGVDRCDTKDTRREISPSVYSFSIV